MKQMKYARRVIAAAALIAALGVGAFGINATLAASNGESDRTTLVEAIAEKFNVNVSDVQAVFDEHHAQMRADFETREADRLAQAVEEGKITQEQADLITDKRAEIASFRASLKDMTPEERRAALKDEKAEIKAWAEENDIPLNVFLPESFGMRGNMHGKGMMGHGMMGNR